MHLLYDGPSQLNGEPIFAVATGIETPSRNQKTGPTLQTYILDKTAPPIEAVKLGQDESICGNCPLRGSTGKARTCYVNVGQAPTNIWNAYKKGRFLTQPLKHLGRGRKIRLGAYGDPAAIPTKIWRDFTKYATGWVGYTHQWEICDPDLSHFCMASVETLQEAEQAQLQGWKTFRITNDLTTRVKGEMHCPAKPGFMTCYQCMACSGQTENVLIQVHGISPKIKAFKEQYGKRIPITPNRPEVPSPQNTFSPVEQNPKIAT